LGTIAIVNAFNPELVQRVTEAVIQKQWARDATLLNDVLYLTGQVRKTGLDSSRMTGMPVACVRHQVAEEWGIRWLAQQVKAKYPDIDVIEVFEDEEVTTRKELLSDT
jgi:putative NIF3 family GTP cyclohydrolase 1 type 2